MNVIDFIEQFDDYLKWSYNETVSSFVETPNIAPDYFRGWVGSISVTREKLAELKDKIIKDTEA